MRKTILDISAAKADNASPLVCLTAYTAPMARVLDKHCDILLVGDSVAMVLYGLPSTLQADMDMMVRHGQAVVRSTQDALIVVDMPFGSYQESKEVAFRNAATILRETGAAAVKLEGGAEMAETIAYLSQRGVPVMGHIGLQPQSVNSLGGYKAQGRDDNGAAKIMADAKAVAIAGAFAIVIEGVAETVAADITKAVSCPTIGIGASATCDGQILVTEDMLGITQGKKPKFVKEYATLSDEIDTAVGNYAAEVRSRQFPINDYTYTTKTDVKPAPATTQPSVEPIARLPETPQQPKSANTFSNLILRAVPRKQD